MTRIRFVRQSPFAATQPPPSKTSYEKLIFKLGKLQLTYLWLNWNLSCLPVVWNLTFYLPEVWLKFKLSTCGLKSHNASIPLDFFYLTWSCIFIFFVFLEERNIKVELNYIFTHLFNRNELQNWANLRWVKCQISNHI